jgi:hypothetical protein
MFKNWFAKLLLGPPIAACFMTAFLSFYNARADNFEAAIYFTLWFVIFAWIIQGECKKLNAPTGEKP